MTTRDDRIASLIDRLVDDARPVRRLWSPAIRLAAWLGILLVVAAALAIAGVRPDVAARLASPGFVAELACLGVATVAAAWIALRGAVPGLEGGPGRSAARRNDRRGRGARSRAIATRAATSFGLRRHRHPVRHPVRRARSRAVRALLWAVRRGGCARRRLAPPASAAALGAYALMRLRCSLDETLHVAIWHGAPGVLATIAAAAIGLVLARPIARRAAPVTSPAARRTDEHAYGYGSWNRSVRCRPRRSDRSDRPPHTRMLAAAVRVVRDDEEARDAVQDGYLQAVRHFDQFDARTASTAPSIAERRSDAPRPATAAGRGARGRSSTTRPTSKRPWSDVNRRSSGA
jgi:hypothetical protein